MFCQTMALSFLGVFLLSQVDLAAGVKCYTCTRDLSDFPKIPTPSFANDACISRDGKKVLDGSAFKVTTDCPDSTPICGSEFRWVVSTTDPSVGPVDTFTLTRGCFARCQDPANFNCGLNSPGPKNKEVLPGTNMTIRSYDFYFRSTCTTDYCNAHPLGGLYMGLLDGNGYAAPSHGAHLAATSLPITLMIVAIMIAQ